jgi:hypothetical protein
MSILAIASTPSGPVLRHLQARAGTGEALRRAQESHHFQHAAILARAATPSAARPTGAAGTGVYAVLLLVCCSMCVVVLQCVRHLQARAGAGEALRRGMIGVVGAHEVPLIITHTLGGHRRLRCAVACVLDRGVLVRGWCCRLAVFKSAGKPVFVRTGWKHVWSRATLPSPYVTVQTTGSPSNIV